jgi:hypothetical protein
MERAIRKSGIGSGIHKKGLSREGRGASEEWMGERFGIGKNCHDDVDADLFQNVQKARTIR